MLASTVQFSRYGRAPAPNRRQPDPKVGDTNVERAHPDSLEGSLVRGHGVNRSLRTQQRASAPTFDAAFHSAEAVVLADPKIGA